MKRNADGKASVLLVLVGQFLRFGLVGVIGFVVDATVLYFALRSIQMDFYSGRLLSYLAAATTTWLLNRRFTFSDASTRPGQQWLRFLMVNGLGGGVNYTVYALLVSFSPPFSNSPVLAVALGSLSGLLLNFAGSKWLVFQAKTGSASA